MAIQPLDKRSAQRLSSDQAVRDLGSAVKELVENSLDANAHVIALGNLNGRTEVRFRNYGLDWVEVSDDGHGIAGDDLEYIGRRHHTSKLRSFDDLSRVESLGFRGEALASLCAISDGVQITTCTTDESPRGTRISLDQHGHVTERVPAARTVGTSVAISGLLARLPVRRAEYQRHAKRVFGQCLRWLQAYAVIASGVKLIVRHQTSSASGNGAGPGSVVMATDGATDMLANIGRVFGLKQAQQLQPVQATFPLTIAPNDAEKSTEASQEAEQDIRQAHIVGFISRAEGGSGRSNSDRQLFYINQRPVLLPKITKIVNHQYRQMYRQQVPVAFLDIQLPTDVYDVNVTPDKRTVMLHHEVEILEALQKHMSELFPCSERSFEVQSNLLRFPSDESLHPQTENKSSDESSSVHHRINMPISSGSSIESDYQAQDIETILASQEMPHESNNATTCELAGDQQCTATPALPTSLAVATSIATSTTQQSLSPTTPGGQVQTKIVNVYHPLELVTAADDHLAEVAPHGTKRPREQEEEEEEEDVEGTVSNSHVSDHRNNSGQWKSLLGEEQVIASTLPDLDTDTPITVCPAPVTSIGRQQFEQDAGITADLSTAEQALSRVVSKDDFSRMRIVGQFNRGFILVILEQKTADADADAVSASQSEDNADLFIIDQHAADEKWWYEQLLAQPVGPPQPLIRPRSLWLGEAERVAVLENRNVFTRNGYDIKVDEESGQLSIIAQPVGADGPSDVEELAVGILAGDDRNTLRPSRHLARCASKACRRAVMVGDPLPLAQMEKIVRRLGHLQHPWHCPHGRPTMRHLINLRNCTATAPIL